MGGAGGAGGVAGAVLAAELCAPLLLVCWLCCWPDDSKSDTSSSGKPPRKPTITNVSGPRRRSSELFGKRFGSSAVSLHLPSTSGNKKLPLSAHRSHEEIRSRRKSHLETRVDDTHYHSAPSVIDEILHRRDWERSTKELYIPLRSPGDQIVSDMNDNTEIKVSSATPESSSLEEKDETIRSCKKHYRNIKSSKGKGMEAIVKETNKDDFKDQDVTENVSNFYIGEAGEDNCLLNSHSEANGDSNTRAITDDESIVYGNNDKNVTPVRKSCKYTDNASAIVCRAKEAKQSFNESIRSKEGPNRNSDSPNPKVYQTYKVFELEVDEVDEIDRSGAIHHTIESRSSISSKFPQYPPPSVEPVGYEGGACYLAEAGCVSELRKARGETPLPGAARPVPRPRYASDGDILALAPRPESGAFSESELELELAAAALEERPPAYTELPAKPVRPAPSTFPLVTTNRVHRVPAQPARETAI